MSDLHPLAQVALVLAVVFGAASSGLLGDWLRARFGNGRSGNGNGRSQGFGPATPTPTRQQLADDVTAAFRPLIDSLVEQMVDRRLDALERTVAALVSRVKSLEDTVRTILASALGAREHKP